MSKAIWDEYADCILGTLSGILFLSILSKSLPVISQVFAQAIKGFTG